MNTITIGRDNSCDIVINDQRVSRVHANLTRNGQGYTIRDTSTNGTQVNGLNVHQREIYLQYGDSVVFAGVFPLSWDKVNNLLPAETMYPPTILYGQQSNSQFQSNGFSPVANRIVKEEKAGLGWLIPGYIFAFLGGYIGIIIGISLMVSKIKLVDGTKVKKFDQDSRNHGVIIMILSFFAFIVWNLIAIANA